MASSTLSPRIPDAWRCLFALLLVVATGSASGQVTLTRGTNFAVDAAPDGQLAIDLLGTIWVLPPGGGVGVAVSETEVTARRPQWSPDGRTIVYQAREGDRRGIRIVDVESGAAIPVGDVENVDRHPAWHPDGDRIVLSSARGDSGFDLWEADVATGLSWRLTGQPGDESDPAWSADGRDLVYVHEFEQTWSIVLRRFGRPERILASSPVRLSSPAWRPDGSLVTVLRHDEAALAVDMIILSDPPLVRPLITGEDFFVAPVDWLDRHRMLYTANGQIRARGFNAWSSSNVPFRVTTEIAADEPAARFVPPQLGVTDLPTTRLVLRVGRVFDGVSPGYRGAADIVVDSGRVESIEPVSDRSGQILVNLDSLTAIPGLIDTRAALPPDPGQQLGPLLLSFGVTTLVDANSDPAALNPVWAGKDMPGPRLLGADWERDLESAPSLILDRSTLPLSPQGRRYEEFRIDAAAAPATVFSGLADARTPGLAALFDSRQASLVGRHRGALRAFVEKPRLGSASAAVVLGSEPNGLAPGIAQHAELRALVAAGMQPEQALRSAGVEAAVALGLGSRVGRIAPGALADIVVVDGDPLADIEDAAKIVGVVRNGRFYSVIGLLDRVRALTAVE